jgi:hypothetical protein
MSGSDLAFLHVHSSSAGGGEESKKFLLFFASTITAILPSLHSSVEHFRLIEKKLLCRMEANENKFNPFTAARRDKFKCALFCFRSYVEVWLFS